MNEFIISEISKNLNIKNSQVEAVLKLLADGNTIPFIARYRKEVTGALDEEVIRSINEVYEYQVNLLKRKEDVIRLIDEKGLLTEDLKKSILDSTKLVEVEDLYRPFKEKKKTKATDAINNGLEPLAKIIMSFPVNGSIEEISNKFLTDKVKTTSDAITGAKYIIAEWISDNAFYRKEYNAFQKIHHDLGTDKKLYLAQAYRYSHDYGPNHMNIEQKILEITTGVLLIRKLPDTVRLKETEAEAYAAVWDIMIRLEKELPMAYVFYGQDTLVEHHKKYDELGIFLPNSHFLKHLEKHIAKAEAIIYA